MLSKLIKLFILLSVIVPTYSVFAKKPFDQKCAPESRLKVITVNYIDFNGKPAVGTLKVLDTLAPYFKNVFNTFYIKKFPIYHMNVGLVPLQPAGVSTSYISYGNAADVDNTAAFACRPITHGTLPSIHAYGAAVDLNPRENPYLGFEGDPSGIMKVKDIIPEDGWKYITRSKYREGKPVHQGISNGVNDVFKDNGILRWGGDWNYPIDYMHFEVYRDVDILLLTMTPEEASQYFNVYMNFYNTCKTNYHTEYAKRNFNDLSKAIAINTGLTPINIYLKQGMSQLMKDANTVANAPSKKLCLLTPTANKAFDSIMALRKIKT